MADLYRPTDGSGYSDREGHLPHRTLFCLYDLTTQACGNANPVHGVSQTETREDGSDPSAQLQSTRPLNTPIRTASVDPRRADRAFPVVSEVRGDNIPSFSSDA